MLSGTWEALLSGEADIAIGTGDHTPAPSVHCETLGHIQFVFVVAPHHPLAAVYRVQVLEAVRRLLAENRLRPFFLFEAVPTRVVAAEELEDVDPTFQTLRNLNTPEDYTAALETARQGDS